jgi:hypothetical protein
MSPLVSTLHDAAVSPEAWPLALKVLTEAMDVGGAALIIANKTTGRVDEACFVGLSAEFKLDYLERYAALDPYSPLLDRSWKKLSECLPESLLRKNEWYNDFILTCGVRDILGTRITDTPNHSAFLGFHQQIGRPFSEKVDSIMNLVAIPLRQATQRHTERFSSPNPGLLDQSRTRFWLVRIAITSMSATAPGIRTKPGRFFPRPRMRWLMPSFLRGNLRQMRPGTDVLFSSRLTWETKFAVYQSAGRMGFATR